MRSLKDTCASNAEHECFLREMVYTDFVARRCFSSFSGIGVLSIFNYRAFLKLLSMNFHNYQHVAIRVIKQYLFDW